MHRTKCFTIPMAYERSKLRFKAIIRLYTLKSRSTCVSCLSMTQWFCIEIPLFLCYLEADNRNQVDFKLVQERRRSKRKKTSIIQKMLAVKENENQWWFSILSGALSLSLILKISLTFKSVYWFVKKHISSSSDMYVIILTYHVTFSVNLHNIKSVINCFTKNSHSQTSRCWFIYRYINVFNQFSAKYIRWSPKSMWLG